LRIAFFVHGYLPWDKYGVPRYIERLANSLVKRGHKIVIISAGRWGLKRYEEINSNYKIYRSCGIVPPSFSPFILEIWSLFSYFFWFLLKAPRIIKKEKIEIIHGHTFEWGGVLALLVSKITKRPCIITIHGSGLARNRLEEKFQRALLQYCDLIICQRKEVLDKIISWSYNLDKVKMLGGAAVDTEKYKPSPTKYNVSPVKITFIGRLEDFRGPELLLDAIPIIIRHTSNVIFQFVGEGRKKTTLLKKVKELNIEKYVTFLGARNDVDKILKDSDIYVASSPYENFSSLALFEAMSTGLAIVATDVGETKKLLEKKETMLLANPTPDSIAEQLLKLIQNPSLRQKLGKNARDLIIEEYSLLKLVKAQENLYMQVLKNYFGGRIHGESS
jgi:glycosyltransferase involved in cell wall biosynthesis